MHNYIKVVLMIRWDGETEEDRDALVARVLDKGFPATPEVEKDHVVVNVIEYPGITEAIEDNM